MPDRRAAAPTGPPLAGLIDTHCHLDAAEYAPDRDQVIARGRTAGLIAIVVPAVAPAGFDDVRQLAHARADAGIHYALGLHPMAVPTLRDEALDQLADALVRHRDDPRLVAVGEIGLDFFVDDPDPGRQERFFDAQLALAARHDLPVIIHSRRANDRIAKALRRRPVSGGIAHAFNGSMVQAQVMIDLGFRLGFGGVMTFERSRRIRQLACQCPLEALVLETDGPDLAPAWLAPGRNEPAELAGIACCLASLRGMPVESVVAATTANARAALPRMGARAPD
ncbi:MAG: TatD family hydrolase [Burkholderiaceae bacterium]